MRWATPQDEADAEMDAMMYGNVFAKRNAHGLMERIDPMTVLLITVPPSRSEPDDDAFRGATQKR